MSDSDAETLACRRYLVLASMPSVDKPEVVTLCGSVRFAAFWQTCWGRSTVGRLTCPTASTSWTPDGYVGPSTASEIEYAETNGKRVTYEHSSTW